MKKALALALFAACAYGQIAGTVRDAASGLPVAGVKLVMIGPNARQAQTGALGEFELDPAPPGKYVILFRRDGYENGSSQVEMKPDAPPLTLKIRPFAELEGVVRDEDGKPLEGVRVYVGGLRDTTDRAGRFHAQDIAAGSYPVALRLPSALRRSTALRDARRRETFGYGYTLYYPGVSDARLAAPVTLAPGAHVTGFEIRLRRSRLVDLQGKLVDAPEGAEVELDSRNGLPEGAYDRRAVASDGGFRFELLEPGEYTLVVHRNRPGDDLPYLAPVHLGEAGVEDLEVELPPFARLEGTVSPERAGLKWEGVLRVILGRLGYETEVRVPPDGRFALQAVPPGEWNLTIETNLAYAAGDSSRKIYVSPLPAQTLLVAEGGNPPLDLTLTDAGGRITGTAEDPGLVTAAQVGGAGALRIALPGADGSFAFDVAPGEYRLSMVTGSGCAEAGETVTVASGGTVNVRLKACDAVH